MASSCQEMASSCRELAADLLSAWEQFKVQQAAATSSPSTTTTTPPFTTSGRSSSAPLSRPRRAPFVAEQQVLRPLSSTSHGRRGRAPTMAPSPARSRRPAPAPPPAAACLLRASALPRQPALRPAYARHMFDVMPARGLTWPTSSPTHTGSHWLISSGRRPPWPPPQLVFFASADLLSWSLYMGKTSSCLTVPNLLRSVNNLPVARDTYCGTEESDYMTIRIAGTCCYSGALFAIGQLQMCLQYELLLHSISALGEQVMSLCYVELKPWPSYVLHLIVPCSFCLTTQRFVAMGRLASEVDFSTYYMPLLPRDTNQLQTWPPLPCIQCIISASDENCWFYSWLVLRLFSSLEVLVGSYITGPLVLNKLMDPTLLDQCVRTASAIFEAHSQFLDTSEIFNTELNGKTELLSTDLLSGWYAELKNWLVHRLQEQWDPGIVFSAYARLLLGVHFGSSSMQDGSCSGYELLSNMNLPGYMSTTLQGLYTNRKCQYFFHSWFIQRDEVSLCTLLISVTPIVGSVKKTCDLARHMDHWNGRQGIKYVEMTRDNTYRQSVPSVLAQLKCDATEHHLDQILNTQIWALQVTHHLAKVGWQNLLLQHHVGGLSPWDPGGVRLVNILGVVVKLQVPWDPGVLLVLGGVGLRSSRFSRGGECHDPGHRDASGPSHDMGWAGTGLGLAGAVDELYKGSGAEEKGIE